MENHILAAFVSIAFLSCSNAPADENPFTLGSHERGVMQVAFSSDGKLLVSVGREGSGFIWNIETRKKQISLKGEDSSFGIAVSPDASRVAILSTCWFDAPFGKVKKQMPTACAIEWKLPSGEPKGRFSKNESLSNRGQGIAYSPNGKILAVGCRDEGKGQVLLWDVEKETLISKLEISMGPVSSISFSPDGTKLAVGAYGSDNARKGEVSIWNVETRKKTCTLKSNELPTQCVAFSPNGKTVAAGGGHLGGPLEKENKSELRMWDVNSEKEIGRFEGHNDPVYSVAFSPDGKVLASGGGDISEPSAELKLWDVASRKELATLKGHKSIIYSVAFSSDGELLASGSQDKSVRLWDVSKLVPKKQEK